jgi:hypothetical protein
MHEFAMGATPLQRPALAARNPWALCSLDRYLSTLFSVLANSSQTSPITKLSRLIDIVWGNKMHVVHCENPLDLSE